MKYRNYIVTTILLCLVYFAIFIFIKCHPYNSKYVSTKCKTINSTLMIHLKTDLLPFNDTFKYKLDVECNKFQKFNTSIYTISEYSIEKLNEKNPMYKINSTFNAFYLKYNQNEVYIKNYKIFGFNGFTLMMLAVFICNSLIMFIQIMSILKKYF